MLPRALASVRIRLLLIALAAVLPVLGLILATAFEQRRVAVADAQTEALRLARSGTREQSRVFEGAHQVLTSLARSPEVLQRDRVTCNARLSEIVKGFSMYTNLVAATPDGAVFCSGTPLGAPLNIGDRPYFQRAVRTRGLTLSEYVIGRSTGRPAIALALPAIDEAGKVRAVVVAGLGFDWFDRFTAESQLPRDSTLTVLDLNAVILARYPDAEKWVGKAVPEAPLSLAIAATPTEGMVEAVGLDGVPRLYAFTRLVTGSGPGSAYLAVGLPTAAVYAATTRILARNLLGLGVVSVLAFAVTWIVADRLVLRRVRTLISATRRLEAGDLSARTGVSDSRGELDELARAFDGMAIQLETRVGQLREAEAKYRALVEQSVVGFDLVGEDKVLYMNEKGASIFGYRADEIGGVRLTDLVHPDDRALVAENLRARLRGEVDALHYSFRGRRKDGTTFHCEVFGRRILYEGQPAVLGTLIDVTERVRDEAELRRLNRALRVLSGSNMTLVRATDETGLLKAVCRLAIDVGGFRFAWVGVAEHDEAKTVRCLAQAGHEGGYLALIGVSWADDEPRQSAVGNAIRSGQPSIVNDISSAPAAALWRTEALRSGYASVIALPLLHAGRPFGVLAIYASEPDAFGAAEVELLSELSDDLAYGIRALRTRAEQQRMEHELEGQRQARHQSDKLAAMGQLLAGVAHELNNPLTVVIGRSAILLQKIGAHPLAQDVEKIEQAAHRCSRIVRNFLALARQQPPERGEVDLNHIVRDAVELLAYHLRVDSIDVAFDLADPLPVIWADPHQLHQVVVNLVINAQHAMRQTPTPRRLTFTTRYSEASRRVRLEVADSGPGIAPEVQARIFEPFFTTKPLGEGTGLGLSLCHGVIEEHGGTILVDSRPGHGAVFQIELPVGPVAVAQAVGSPEAAAPAIARSILVVDDEPEVAAMLIEMLAADGHRVETAANGAEALAKLTEGNYDLILSDVRMPGMDGPTLYGELKRRFPQLARRIIFFTADSLSSEIREFLDRIEAPRVSKPFDFSDLRRAVERVGRGSSAGSQ